MLIDLVLNKYGTFLIETKDIFYQILKVIDGNGQLN